MSAQPGVQPWQRPPFAPGHELSIRHGAYSRQVAPRAAEFVGAVLTMATAEGSPVSYLADPTYLPALEAWARAEAQQDLLESYLEQAGGPIDGKGKIRPAAELLERVARRAERMRARLGLDPMARASLSKDLAVARTGRDLEALKAVGQALLDAAYDDVTHDSAADTADTAAGVEEEDGRGDDD